MDLNPVTRPKLGQQVWVRRRYTHAPYTYYYQRGRIEILRRHEAVVRVYGYELTAPFSELFTR